MPEPFHVRAIADDHTPAADTVHVSAITVAPRLEVFQLEVTEL